MPTRLVAVAFDAREPTAVARFWAELLGRAVVHEGESVLLPGDEWQVGLRFAAASTQKVGLNRRAVAADLAEWTAAGEEAVASLDHAGLVVTRIAQHDVPLLG